MSLMAEWKIGSSGTSGTRTLKTRTVAVTGLGAYLPLHTVGIQGKVLAGADKHDNWGLK
jgi:hypothetical protein